MDSNQKLADFESKLTELSSKLNQVEIDMNENNNGSIVKGIISSAASSDINSQPATPFQSKRVFIKGNDGSGTGGGAGGSILAQNKALIIRGSRLTIEQLENKITELKEDLNKYV